MNSRRVTCLQAGFMFFPPNRNGNMPVVRERPRPIRGDDLARQIVPVDIRVDP